MNNKVVFIFISLLLVSACSSPPQRKIAPPEEPKVSKATAPGGYLQGDGPEENAPANIDSIPDAVPKSEPLHRYANHPYMALGKSYTPLTIPGNFKQRGIASWYGKKFNGERTSSGEIYDMYSMTAAHPTLPIPSYARVTNLANKKSVVVRINDRGPFMNDRIIDLSYTAAHKLGIIGDGSAEVEVESIDPNVSLNTIEVSNVQSQPLETTPPGPITTTPLAAASSVVSAPLNSENIPASSSAAPLNSNEAAVYLQLGAFSTQAAAETYRDKVRNILGETGKDIKLTTKDGLVRVHIGPYSNIGEARSSAANMESKLGFKPIVNLP